MFRFGKTCHWIPQWLYDFAFPSAMNKNSFHSTSCMESGAVSVLAFGHCYQSIAVSHCCSELESSNNIKCWASFHVVTCHLIGSLVRCCFCLLYVIYNGDKLERFWKGQTWLHFCLESIILTSVWWSGLWGWSGECGSGLRRKNEIITFTTLHTHSVGEVCQVRERKQ